MESIKGWEENNNHTKQKFSLNPDALLLGLNLTEHVTRTKSSSNERFVITSGGTFHRPTPTIEMAWAANGPVFERTATDIFSGLI